MEVTHQRKLVSLNCTNARGKVTTDSILVYRKKKKRKRKKKHLLCFLSCSICSSFKSNCSVSLDAESNAAFASSKRS